MKICTKCALEKLLVEFSKNKKTKDGLQHECKACMAARARDYYFSKSALINERRAQVRKDNPGPARARDATYYAANAQKVAQYSAVYYQKNKENRRRYSSEWSKRNPGARNVVTQNRRAKVCSSNGALSKGLSDRLFKRQRGLCPCCANQLGDDYHLDHKMPLALGGSNTDDNMQLLRAQCNRQKAARHPIEFMQSRGFLL